MEPCAIEPSLPTQGCCEDGEVINGKERWPCREPESHPQNPKRLCPPDQAEEAGLAGPHSPSQRAAAGRRNLALGSSRLGEANLTESLTAGRKQAAGTESPVIRVFPEEGPLFVFFSLS